MNKLFIGLILLTSFALYAQSTNNKIVINNSLSGLYDLNYFQKRADTFIFFLFPKPDSNINWNPKVLRNGKEKDLFNINDSYINKVRLMTREMFILSDAANERDRESERLEKQIKNYKAEMGKIDECLDDYSDYYNPSNNHACEILNGILNTSYARVDKLATVVKPAYLRGIQKIIDDVNFKDLGNGEFLRIGNPINWQDFNEATDQILDLRKYSQELKDFEKCINNQNELNEHPDCSELSPDPSSIKISLLTGNPSLNKYSTNAGGEIYDVKYQDSPFTKGRKILEFKVNEKDKDGLLTGRIWNVQLEKLNFAGKIRFQGDVIIYKDQNSKIKYVEQRGAMMLDLSRNEE